VGEKEENIHTYRNIYMNVNRYLCNTFRSMCENGCGCSGSEILVLGSERMMESIGLWCKKWGVSLESGGEGGEHTYI